MDLTGKSIAVTGVASGIGAATARLLIAAGAAVYGFDRNRPDGELAGFQAVDLARPESIGRAAAAFGTPFDALCNIAGVPPTVDKHLVLGVNFFGLRAFTEAMADRLADGAAIVNVASLAGYQWRSSLPVIREGLAVSMAASDAWIERLDVDGAPSYQLSKELVIAWTMANARRWGARGIRMNCVSPGPVSTPILPDFVRTLGKRAEDDLKENRAGRADEIAPVIAFLCSDAARWIIGADIAVDGGAGAAIWQKLLAAAPEPLAATMENEG